MSSNLSDYEKLRAENIRKNNARLRSLGLISALEERVSNNDALGISNPPEEKETIDNKKGDDDDEYEDVSISGSTGKKKRKRGKVTVSEPREGTRKSLRLQGINISGNLKDIQGDDKSKDVKAIQRERMERVRECRETRLRAAKAVAEAGSEAAAKENPTATYEHCLMRVKTMKTKALVTRVSILCSLRLNGYLGVYLTNTVFLIFLDQGD